MKNVIDNTAQQDPLGFLGEAMAKGASAAIEASESRGQTQFVASDVLPVKWLNGDKAVLEKEGVVFGAVCEGDCLFQEVALPAGWHKEATEHSMWSELLDHKNRVRAKIFYKAACYDRGAHISLATRFTYSGYKFEGKTVVLDGEEIIHELPITGDGYKGKQAAEERCLLWLTDKYPNWRDPAEYWDDEIVIKD